MIHCKNCSCPIETTYEVLKNWRWEMVISTGKKAFEFLYDEEISAIARLAKNEVPSISSIRALLCRADKRAYAEEIQKRLSEAKSSR